MSDPSTWGQLHAPQGYDSFESFGYVKLFIQLAHYECDSFNYTLRSNICQHYPWGWLDGFTTLPR